MWIHGMASVSDYNMQSNIHSLYYFLLISKALIFYFTTGQGQDPDQHPDLGLGLHLGQGHHLEASTQDPDQGQDQAQGHVQVQGHGQARTQRQAQAQGRARAQGQTQDCTRTQDHARAQGHAQAQGRTRGQGHARAQDRILWVRHFVSHAELITPNTKHQDEFWHANGTRNVILWVFFMLNIELLNSKSVSFTHRST